MRKFRFDISFKNNDSKKVESESNSMITAMSAALNTLNDDEKETIMNISVTCLPRVLIIGK
ncbi:hypothetical protein [Evansella clarkii]|uniref:hypothetical protein n=1 Tax=Evansella clarkii TaxID=79879 RepID=UPI000998B083|nr:hypothetical protein [Evansella clarkii]